jgi:hypothetical protein
MSADLIAMQETINRFKSPKMFSAPSVQQQRQGAGGKGPAGHGSALQHTKKAAPDGGHTNGFIGFRSDFAKLRYPEVDVRAVDL